MILNKNILITGATGFIGNHLLYQLLNEENINYIYVINRNVNNLDGMFLGASPIINYNKWGIQIRSEDLNRVKTLYGDISKVNLGIENKVYEELSENIDVIYHLAASVNHVKSYEGLKSSNVDSVAEIIKLSKSGKSKVINFVSTLGAAAKKDHENNFVEDFPDDTPIFSSMGYLRSKYEAEKLLTVASSDSLVNIFRLGYISGHYDTGVSLYENNQLMLFIKSCIQLGYAPILERTINLTPVDFTVKILSSQMFMHSYNNVMHLANCDEYITWVELIEFLNKKRFSIKLIDLNLWQQLLIKAGRSNALYRFILTYRRVDADNHIIRFGKNIRQYQFDSINKFCKSNGIVFPKIKYTYLDRVVSYLIKVGFISYATY